MTEEKAAYNRKWYQKNKDAILKKTKEFRQNNPEIIRKRKREYYQNNKDKVRCYKRDYRLKRTIKTQYGIDYDTKLEMLKAQDNRCKICKQIFDGSSTGGGACCIDHCHKTGKVRGLLCRRCNGGIGLLNDKTDNLINALEYLRSHELDSINEEIQNSFNF